MWRVILSCAHNGVDPATGEIIRSVMNCNKDQAVFAIESAKKAFPAWSQMNPTVHTTYSPQT